MDRRTFLAIVGGAIVAPLGGYWVYKKWFRPDRALNEAKYHVFVESTGIEGQRVLHFNIVDMATGEPISTGSYQDRDKQEQEQLRFGESGEVFFKLTETNLRKGFNKKEETAKISSGKATEGKYPNLWTVLEHNQYHWGSPKVTEVLSPNADGVDTLVCKIIDDRGKMFGFRGGVQVTVGDKTLLHSYDADRGNIIGIEAKERVDVYGGSHKYYIDTDHAFFDVRQHSKNWLWDLKGVKFLDGNKKVAASIKIEDSWRYKQPVYVFTIGNEVVGRIIRDERIIKHYHTEYSTDKEGDTTSNQVEDSEKREAMNGFYVLEGTNIEKCNMLLTLMAEKLIQLKWDYKRSWIDFGVDLLKLSQNPNEPEFALHLPLDMNLTPNWIARSLETVFGYKPPEDFRKHVGYAKE